MAAAATLKGRITMDDDAFQRTLRRTVNSSERAGRSMARSFISAGTGLVKLTSIVGGLTTAIAGVGAAAGSFRILKSAIASASEMEDLRINMEAFLGSAESANEVIKELTAFSLKTPFETEDLLEASKILAGAGIQKNLTGIAKELAAVSKNGQQLRELGDALAKGFAKGKFQTEELNKFLERGINLMPQLERVTGNSGDALTKAIQKGLRFEDVTEAIRGMSAESGQFYGLLEQRSKTTSGLISTLISGWREFQRALGEPVSDAIKPGLDILIERLKEGQDLAKQIGERLADGVGLFIEAWRSDLLSELIGSSIKLGFLKGIKGGREILIEQLSGAIEKVLNPFSPGTTAAVQTKARLAAAGQLTPEISAAIDRTAGAGQDSFGGLDVEIARERAFLGALAQGLREQQDIRRLTQSPAAAVAPATAPTPTQTGNWLERMVDATEGINRKMEE